MKRRSFGLVKIYFVIFVVYIGFFLCVKFGIPYIYEKYGMPVDAVVYGMSKDTKGSFLARYEFIVDQKKYRGKVPIVMFMKEIQYVFGIFLFFLG